MTTYTWKIVELERELEDGFVFTAHYEVEASDNVYKSGAYGSITFNRPDETDSEEQEEEKTSEEFIPYADLTEEIVVGWVKDNLGDYAVLDTETVLQEAIDEQASPTKALGMPW